VHDVAMARRPAEIQELLLRMGDPPRTGTEAGR
jgi:hypothetical protein